MKTFAAELGDRRYVASTIPVDIAIAIDFDGAQPSFFGAEPASAQPMRSGDFVGDTRAGGSCNAAHVELIAHCNGTHTECVGHITDERVSVHTLATAPLYPCTLVSVEPADADPAITATTLRDALADRLDTEALCVRTLPNGPDKRSRSYRQAPYFTAGAMEWIVAQDIAHLLVDMPSVDRLDNQALTAHRIFWGLDAPGRSVADARRATATITELVYVPDEARDGHYLLDLQIAPFVSDAAPSRPLLYALIDGLRDW